MISNTNTNTNKQKLAKDNQEAIDECETQLCSIQSLLQDNGDNFRVIGLCIVDLKKEIQKTGQQGATIKGFLDAMKQSGIMLKKNALEMFFGKYYVNGEISEMLFFTKFPELSQIKSLNCDNCFLNKPPKFEYDASLKFLSTLSMAYQYFNILTHNPYHHIQYNPNEHLAYEYLKNTEYKSHPEQFTTTFKIQTTMNLFRIIYENPKNYENDLKFFFVKLKQNLSISTNLFLSTEEEKREALLLTAYGIIYSKFANYSQNYLDLAKEIFYYNPLTNSFPIENKWKIGYFKCMENIIKKIDLENYLIDVVTQIERTKAENILLFIEAYLDNFLGNELNPERNTQVETNFNIMKSTRILSYIFNSLLSCAILTSTNLNNFFYIL